MCVCVYVYVSFGPYVMFTFHALHSHCTGHVREQQLLRAVQEGCVRAGRGGVPHRHPLQPDLRQRLLE
jgi:hypothetical protein